MKKELVLVTGGTGFIAVHIILQLLNQGYWVRTTLRTMSRQKEVKAMLTQGGAKNLEDLEFVQADLTSDDHWLEAASGATYVIHVASPTPATRPDDGAAMVKMAVDGVTRVMTAAKKAGVKRVVLTSASGAVIAGHKKHPQLFTEKDWTNLSGNIDAYQRSKIMAELAAWDYAKKGRGGTGNSESSGRDGTHFRKRLLSFEYFGQRDAFRENAFVTKNEL